jgi:hypothetical protein
VGGTETGARPSFSSRFYYALRVFLHRRRGFLRLAHTLRGYLLLGPLRTAVLRYEQKSSANAPLARETSPLFPDLHVDEAVTRIDDAGYTHIGELPEEWISQILAYCERHQLVRYWNPHKDCETIDRLCRNAKVVDIARKYLGAEPRLWLTQLRWSFLPAGDRRPLSLYREPVQYDTHAFHYDMLDVKSLTMFVYLTEVDLQSGPHEIIEGTHKSRTFWEIRNRVFDTAVVREKYRDRIKVIVGRKGTAFLEDTGTLHRASDGTKPRLILSLDYVLNRTLPPARALLTDAGAE